MGAGVDVTTIKSPATLSLYFVTGTNNNYPVVFVDGATGVDISDLTIDGDKKGMPTIDLLALDSGTAMGLSPTERF